MKTVKIYNHNTGQWETIAGVSTTDGSINPEVIQTLIDGQQEILAKLDSIISRLDGMPGTTEPVSDYYVEYTIDNSASTFSLRSVDNPINNGHYIPQFSNGYDYIKLTLTDGSVTTNIETDASQVEKIKIYYPEETTSIKFKDTKVKTVEYINCTNITDATEMFKNCTSLQSADLSTMNSTNVTVDASMFQGANTEVQLVLNDEWSYNNRDMGLIKHVEVVMHHYREDGLYEYNDIYIKSQYDEHPTQYVIRQVDPVDGRWRYEPLYLECDVTYEIYFEDSGFTGETMTVCVMGNMDIFFVGGLPNSFAESRPEIGGSEEPEEEYITGFSLDTAEFYMYNVGQYYRIGVIPNEEGRPMNFVVDFPNSSWGAVSYDYASADNAINFILNSECMPVNGNVTIRETYSSTTQDVYIWVQPTANLTVHYKDVNGDASSDYLTIEGINDFYFGSCSTDDYGYVFSERVGMLTNYNLILTTSNGPVHLGQINISRDTHIWLAEDSSEILYENPNPGPSEPEEPSTNVNVTVHYRATDGSIENNEVDFCNTEEGVSHWVRFDGDRTEVFTDDFGYYSTLNLPAYSSYKVAILGNYAEQSDWFEQTLDATYDREIWIIDNELKYYTERPEIGGGDEPVQDYITGFCPDSYDQKITQYGTSQFSISINEMGKQIDFTAYFEDVTYSDPDALCVTFITEGYDNQWSGQISCNIAYQGPEAVTGQATLVIKENNSNITERITVVIQEAATLKLHYNRTLGDYDYWNVWEWCYDGSHGNTNGKATYFSSTDDYGQIAELKVAKGCNIGYIIRKTTPDNEWEEKDWDGDQYIQVDNDMEIWIIQNQEGYHTERPEIPTLDDYEYYVEYTIDTTNAEDEVGSNFIYENDGNTYYRYIPILNNKYNPAQKVIITKNDDTTTEDLTTKVSDTKFIRAYYQPNTTHLAFMSPRYGNDINRVKRIEYIKTNNFNSFERMFFRCKNLEFVNTSAISTDNAWSLREMFYGCESLTSLGDLNSWYTGNVNDMYGLFYDCKNLTSLNISNWSVDCVNNMSYMFNGCSALTSLDVSNWNTNSLTSMVGIFGSCTSLTEFNVSNWDVSSVTDMDGAFLYLPLETIDLSKWDTSSLINISGMFARCSNLKTVTGLTNWNTSKMEDISSMFSNCNSLVSVDLSAFNTSNIKEAYFMFSETYGVNITVSEGLWTLRTEPDSFGGNDLVFNIIPCDITSLNVTTDVEDLNNLNTHKFNYTLSIQPEANGMLDLETVYDSTYIKLNNNNTIKLLEGAQGKQLSVTFRSKRNNEISQTIEFTLNADYVMPTFDRTIDFTELNPKFPEWMEEYSSGEYTFELGNFMEGVDGLVSNNSSIDSSTATKVYTLTPEEDCNMTIYYRNQSESGCDYLVASITTDESNINYSDNQFLNSSDGDHIDTDAYGITSLTGGTTYYLIIAYTKDGSVSNGVDKACIRSIKFE